MKHYVYKLEDKKSGEFYFGSRTCHTNIEDDDYMGSMKTWNPNKENLIKTILKSDFDNREDANEYEIQLLISSIYNPLNRNYHIPSKGFCTYGRKMTTNEKIKISNSIKKWIDGLTQNEKREKFGSLGKNNPMYGKVYTEIEKENHSIVMKHYYKNNKAANLGRKFDESWRKNLSESRIQNGVAKGSKNPKSYGNVKITDLEGNEFIFDTAKEASKHFGVDRFTLTQHCINQTSYQRGKLKGWKFKID